MGVVAGEVDGFGDLRVSLGDGLRTVKHHATNKILAAASQLGSNFQ